MQFTELVFVPFLLATFFLFAAARKSLRAQLLVLLAASFVFYAWWDLRILGLIVIVSVLNYYLGQRIHKAKERKKKKRLLIAGIMVDLGVLVYFKYVNFFIPSLTDLLNLLGLQSGSTLVIPLGISFFTFWTLGYIIDVYTERTEPAGSLASYLVFATGFPHITAGPIVRARDYLSQLGGNLYAQSNHEGIFLILYGFLKKIFLADTLGRLFVDPVFQGKLPGYTSSELLLAIYCYSFQVFFDFSAYSDIAVGVGKVFGLRYPVNFEYPYSATNPPGFWKKWHITLSFWLRDYLFLPITYGVMRKAKAPLWLHVKVERWAYLVGMLATMVLCGLWHGASWTFVLWGGLHGSYLVVYNILPSRFKKKKKTPKLLRAFLFFNLVAVTWVFFRSPSVGYAISYIRKILEFSWGFTHFPLVTVGLLLAVSLAVHSLLEPRLGKIAGGFNRLHWAWHALIIYALFVLLAYWGEKAVANQAFIYFRF